MRIMKLEQEARKNLLEDLLKRSPNQYYEYEKSVSQILDKVRRGDQALFSYTMQFDHAKIDKSTIRVTDEEIEEAYRLADPSLIQVIKSAWEYSFLS